jgi:hypothetical protein
MVGEEYNASVTKESWLNCARPVREKIRRWYGEVGVEGMVQ